MTLALLGCGCGATLPTPAEGSHRQDTPVVVPYPPPAPPAEIVPLPPSDDAVWVDGSYVWNGRDYEWVEGGWQHDGRAHAPMTTVRLPNGELSFYRGIARVAGAR